MAHAHDIMVGEGPREIDTTPPEVASVQTLAEIGVSPRLDDVMTLFIGSEDEGQLIPLL